MWVWVGLVWARYFALSLPTAAVAAAAGEAPVARAGFFPRLRGVLGVAAWSAEAVARPAGAAVATPRAPSSLSSAAVAAAGEAPVARAGSVSRVRGVLGVAAWPAEAVARPARVAAAAPRAPSSLSFAAVAATGEAPVARAGSAPRLRGMLGVAAWSAEAVARPAGAAVATPRAPFSLSSAAAAALGDAPGSCAGATPRVGGVPGAAVGAAAWLAGAAVSASCASGAPSRGGAAGLAAWGARAVISAGSGSRAGGGGPTSTAASASLRSSRSARVSPVHSVEAGERERDRRWWRSSRWREPSESAITVILVGMRGSRRGLPTTSWCISAVPSAVPWGALRGGGGEGVGGLLWRQPRTAGGPAIHRHWEGRRGSHAAHASRHTSQSGAGPRALGPRGSSSGVGGSRTRWTPVTAVTSCVRRKVCTPSRAAGRREGGAGYGCCPIEPGGGDPQDPPRVPAGRDDEEEQGGARAFLPEDLPPVVGTPGSGEGGGQVCVSPAAGRVRRRLEGGAPSGLPGERLAYDGVRGGTPGAVIHWVGRPGAGGRLVRAFHEHRDLAHLQVLVRWV